MAAVGFLFALGYFLLPIIAVVWVYNNSKRIDQLAENVGQLLRRSERSPANAAAAPNAAPPQQTPAAAPAAGATVTPAVPAPAPAAQDTPRKDSVFADNTVFTGADGEEWVEINDAPAAKPAYFNTPGKDGVPRAAARVDGDDVFEKLCRWMAENWMLATGALFVFLSSS